MYSGEHAGIDSVGDVGVVGLVVVVVVLVATLVELEDDGNVGVVSLVVVAAVVVRLVEHKDGTSDELLVLREGRSSGPVIEVAVEHEEVGVAEQDLSEGEQPAHDDPVDDDVEQLLVWAE